MTPERIAEIKESQKHGNVAYVDELLEEIDKLRQRPEQGVKEAVEQAMEVLDVARKLDGWAFIDKAARAYEALAALRTQPVPTPAEEVKP
jgi:MoxR-like ATPase